VTDYQSSLCVCGESWDYWDVLGSLLFASTFSLFAELMHSVRSRRSWLALRWELLTKLAIPEAWTFWKKEPILCTDFSYELPTQTVMCPSGSSSRRNRYRANWFSIRSALLYCRSIEICIGKIGNGRNFCILLIRNRQPLPLNRANQKLSFGI